jgi:tetratricopeptide (TPR) repeat protein
MAKRFPGDAHVKLSQAHLLVEAGEVTLAVEAYRVLLGLHPELASGWFNLAYLLEQQGEWAPAQRAFERALACQPLLDRAWYGLGRVLIRSGRLDEAVDALTRNTELQPLSPHGWYLLAHVQCDRQDRREASRIIEHLKGFEPRVAAQLEREMGALLAASVVRPDPEQAAVQGDPVGRPA